MGKLLFFMLFVFPGCAAMPVVSLSAATRVLGVATTYRSVTGERLEIIHDFRAGVAIIKRSDGTMAVLPAEYVGLEGHYKDTRMNLWEHDSDVLLWVDGGVVFSGTIEQ